MRKINISKRKQFIICMFILFVVALFVYWFIPNTNQERIPFFNNVNAWGDLGVELKFAMYTDPYEFISGNRSNAWVQGYPPMAYAIIHLFNRTVLNNSSSLVIAYFMSFSLFLILYLSAINSEGDKIEKIGMIISFAFSGMFLFAFGSGNIVIISALLAAFYLYYYDSDNKFLKELAYISLAVSSAIKIFPAILGVVLIAEKKYKDAIRLIIYGIILFFAPFLFFHGGFKCIKVFLENIAAFSSHYSLEAHPTFNFKFWAVQIGNEELKRLVFVIFQIVDKALIILAIIASILEKSKWKRIMILSLSMIFFSVHSGFYMAIFWVPSIVFFFDAKKTKNDWIYLILIVMIFNPFTILIRCTTQIRSWVTSISASLLFLFLLLDIMKTKMMSVKKADL